MDIESFMDKVNSSEEKSQNMVMKIIQRIILIIITNYLLRIKQQK